MNKYHTDQHGDVTDYLQDAYGRKSANEIDFDF